MRTGSWRSSRVQKLHENDSRSIWVFIPKNVYWNLTVRYSYAVFISGVYRGEVLPLQRKMYITPTKFIYLLIIYSNGISRTTNPLSENVLYPRGIGLK